MNRRMKYYSRNKEAAIRDSLAELAIIQRHIADVCLATALIEVTGKVNFAKIIEDKIIESTKNSGSKNNDLLLSIAQRDFVSLVNWLISGAIATETKDYGNKTQR